MNRLITSSLRGTRVGQGGETADQGYLGLPAPYPEANHTGCGTPLHREPYRGVNPAVPRNGISAYWREGLLPRSSGELPVPAPYGNRPGCEPMFPK